MLEVFAAVTRALRDLTRGGLILHALWPPLLSVLGWGFVAIWVWKPAVDAIATWLPTVSWSRLSWLTDWAAGFLFLCALAPLVYVTTVLLLGAVALPRMMTLVALRHYPDLSRQGSTLAVIWGSIANTLKVSVIYLLGWMLTLPLLLIPGVLLVLPLLWTAWMNQRSFRFDALADHATPTEMQRLFQREGRRLRLAGIITALANYVPILNLIAPAFAGLVFMHLCLGALRRLRQEEGITL